MTTSTPTIGFAPQVPLGALLRIIPEFRRDPLGTMRRARETWGDIVRFRVPWFTGYLVSDPALIEEILVNRQASYSKKTPAYDVLRQMLGNGLITSEGSFWLRQRRIAQPAFHRQHIATLVEMMVGCGAAMLDRWQARVDDGAPFDMAREMRRVTLEIVGRALLSIDVSADAAGIDAALAVLNAQAMMRSTQPWTLPLVVPTPMNVSFRAAKAVLDDLVKKTIVERRARGAPFSGEGGRIDLLATVMGTVDDETGERMDDQQLHDEVMTLFLAGHDTTAATMAWVLYLLAKAPDIEQRARDEVDAALGGGPPGLEDLPRLPLVDRIVKETLRLYPAIWMLGRVAEQRETLGGCVIDKGSFVFFSPYVVQRHATYWPEPDRFDPDRFLGHGPDVPRYAYFPFSGGPRKCIGDTFALVEAQLLVALLLQRVELTLVPGQDVEPDPTITIKPKGPVMMTARARPGSRAPRPLGVGRPA